MPLDIACPVCWRPRMSSVHRCPPLFDCRQRGCREWTGVRGRTPSEAAVLHAKALDLREGGPRDRVMEVKKPEGGPIDIIDVTYEVSVDYFAGACR